MAYDLESSLERVFIRILFSVNFLLFRRADFEAPGLPGFKKVSMGWGLIARATSHAVANKIQ